MEASYRYFENRACKYYPCHEGNRGDELSVLFLPALFFGTLSGQTGIYYQ